MKKYLSILYIIILFLFQNYLYSKDKNVSSEILKYLESGSDIQNRKGLYLMLKDRYNVDISNDYESIKGALTKLLDSGCKSYYVRLGSAEMLFRYYDQVEPWLTMAGDDDVDNKGDSYYRFREGSVLRMGFKVNDTIEKGVIDPAKLSSDYFLYYYGKNFSKYDYGVQSTVNDIKKIIKKKDYLSWSTKLSFILEYPDEDIIQFAKEQMLFFNSLSNEQLKELNFLNAEIEHREDVIKIFRNYIDEEAIDKITKDYFKRLEGLFGREGRFGIEERIYNKVRTFCRYMVDDSKEALTLREKMREKLLIALGQACIDFSDDKNIIYAIDYAEDMIKNDKQYGGTGDVSGERPQFTSGWGDLRLIYLSRYYKELKK